VNKVVYGFAVEPHKDDYWLVSAATKEGDVITFEMYEKMVYENNDMIKWLAIDL
jgi:hypothetical protein